MPGVYDLDPVHTFVMFRVRHLVVGRVDGRLKSFEGQFTVVEDSARPFDRFEVTFEPASLDTHVKMRDDDLRSARFLDSDHFPTIVLSGGTSSRVGDGAWTVDADLTIRAVTRPVVLEVSFRGQPGCLVRAELRARNPSRIGCAGPASGGVSVRGTRSRPNLPVGTCRASNGIRAAHVWTRHRFDGGRRRGLSRSLEKQVSRGRCVRRCWLLPSTQAGADPDTVEADALPGRLSSPAREDARPAGEAAQLPTAVRDPSRHHRGRG